MTTKSRKSKVITAVTAVAMAVVLLLGGTFAWQSINQTALNEASDVINPGGRLHDDFNGTNKDVYVENFAKDPIFARVRLDEYFEIVMNKGAVGAEKTEVITKYENEYGDLVDAVKGDTDTYVTHLFGETNATDEYWNWTTGGSTIYMPTFNMNKDSLAADINGTYEGPDGTDGVYEGDEEDRYEDNHVYSDGEEKTDLEIYDADTDSIDDVGTDFDNLTTYEEDGNIVIASETHTAKSTLDATLISMDEWKTTYNSEPGEYWVYDTDGWVYWAQPIEGGTATGLLLDGIELTQVMDDSWYYAINVIAQFVTADDLGRGSGTGFYDLENGTAPTDNALKLLEAIGVDTTSVVDNADSLREALEAGSDVVIDGEIVTDAADDNRGLNFDFDYLWSEGGTVSGGTINSTSGSYATLFINNENNWPDDGDSAYDAVLNDTEINTQSTFGVYAQAIDADATLNNVTISGGTGGFYAEYGNGTVTLNNVTVTAEGGNDTKPWFNSAVAAGMGANVVVNSGSYTGDYAAYVYSSGATLTINGGYFDGELKEDKAALIIQGGTFTADPTKFVADGYEVVTNEDGTYTVQAIGGDSEGGDSDEVTVLTSFTNTDDLSATPYVVFTADESGEGALMYFTRTFDDITTDPSQHTVDGRTVTEVYAGAEDSWYYNTEKYDNPWNDEWDDTWTINESADVTKAVFINKMQPVSTRYWFYCMTNLKTITGLEKLDTSKCTSMRGMFQGSEKLSELDVSHFDTSLVTSMSDMFATVPCDIIGLENFDTSKCTEMDWMFNYCVGLTELDLSGWDVSNVTLFAGMFQYCENLTSIKGAENWTPSSANWIYSMFYECSKLELDCSKWDVSTATLYDDFNKNAPGVVPPSFPAESN